MDYDRLLSAEMRAFVAETAAFAAPGAASDDWPAQRAAYDRMAAAFHAGRPAGLSVRDDRIRGVPVRIYGQAAGTIILYAHGGGFVLGGLDSHDDVCAEIAQRTGRRLVSVDYRLAPEHPHPAAYDDLAAVAEALLAEGPLVLAGDSAGGALCAALAGTRADPGFAGMALIYPLLGHRPEDGSFDAHAHAPLLTRADLAFYARIRGGDPSDPRLNPSRGDLGRLPPTRLFPAECDPLRDDALRYARAASTAGADVTAEVQPGLVHGWLRARGRGPVLRGHFSAIVAALTALTR